MPKPGNKRFVIVIRDADKAGVEARGHIKTLFGPVDAHPYDDVRGVYFKSPLIPVASPSGSPATHWWACAETSNGRYNALLNMANNVFTDTEVAEYDEITNLLFPHQFIAGLGLKKQTGGSP